MSDPVFLCTIDDLTRTGSFGVTVTCKLQEKHIVLVRDPESTEQNPHFHAYLNACPHLAIPLETFEHDFLDRENETLLVCSTHGARFKISDGSCILGPCKGDSLTRLSITIRKNEVFLID